MVFGSGEEGRKGSSPTRPNYATMVKRSGEKKGVHHHSSGTSTESGVWRLRRRKGREREERVERLSLLETYLKNYFIIIKYIKNEIK